MAVIDAAMELIKSLDNPELFVRKDRVSVFKPHKRTFPEQRLSNGKVIAAQTVEVTDFDLPVIAANINRAYEDEGQLVKLAIGHRKYDPAFPENQQPPIAGYARNYRAEVVERPNAAGKALRLTHSEYIHRRKPQGVAVLNGEYPERSPEYDPDGKTITGVALLTRDQALTLGTVSYEAGGDKVIYQMGTEMSDVATVDDTDVTKDPDFVKFTKFMAAYEATKPKVTSATTVPAGTVTYDKPTGTFDPATFLLQEQNRIYQAERDTAIKDRDAAECKRLLDPLSAHRSLDYETELATLVALPADQRLARCDYIAAHYAQLPVGGMIRLADTVPTVQYARGDDATLPEAFKKPENYDKAMKIVNDNPGITWEEAKRRAAA